MRRGLAGAITRLARVAASSVMAIVAATVPFPSEAALPELAVPRVLGPDVNGVGRPNLNFGYQVAYSGDTAAVMAGSVGIDQIGNAYAGIFVYTWNGAAWIQEALLIPPDANAGHSYSWGAMALEGNRLVVSDDFQGGHIHVYERGASGWTQTAFIDGADGVPVAC